MDETPDRSTPGTEPEPGVVSGTTRGPLSRPRALTNWQIRLLCVGLALAQVVTGAGLWLGLPVAAGATAHHWLAGLSAIVAATAVVLFSMAWLVGGPVSRVERNTIVALAINPVWGMVIGLMIQGPDEAQEYDTYATFLIGVFGGLVVLHLIPAVIMLFAVHWRLGSTDADWSPHEASNGDKGVALLGLSIMTGGWTAALGLIGTFVVYGGGSFDSTDLPGLLVALAFVQGFGMVLGLFAAVVSSTIPASTRLDRSVPRIFLPAMGTGVIGSAIFPLLGIPAAAITLLIMCIVTRRTCRLYPEGHCQHCNYDLAGLAEPVCPECGKAASAG
mgnify:CR=1 FL=1